MSRIALLAAVALALGCSNDTADDTDVNEDKLHGSYQVHYIAGERVLEHYAQLRLGGPSGTTIRLTEGTLAVDGQEMRESDGDTRLINLTGTYYLLRQSTDMPPAESTFTWTRTDGSTYDNVVPTLAGFTIAEPADGATVTDGDLVVRLDGPALAAGERYLATVTAEARAGEGEDGQLSQRIDAGDSIIFPADDVATLPAGGLTIRVRKSITNPAQEGHGAEGGELTSMWTAPEIAVQRAEPTQ